MQFSNVTDSSICPVFSPCSKFLASIVSDSINITDTIGTDLKNHCKIQIKEKTIPTIRFSPDSQLIGVKFLKKVEIYDLFGRLKARIQEDSYEVENFLWANDAYSCQLIVFYKNLLHCQIYNLQTQSISIIKGPKCNNESGCTFSKGSQPGMFTAFLQRHGTKDSIGIYFTKTWQLVNYITLQSSFDIGQIQFAENGCIIAIQRIINFKFYVIDPLRGVIADYGDKNYVLGFCCHKFSNNGKILALGALDNCLHIINTDIWKPICEIQMTNEINLTKTMLFKEENNNFIPLQGTRHKLQKKQQSGEGDKWLGINLLEFSPNDQYFAVRIQTMPSNVFIYSITRLELISVVSLSKGVKDFKWMENDEDEIVLCIAYGSSSLLIWKESEEVDRIFEISIPTVTDLKINRIQQGKDKKVVFYSNVTKKYVYAIP